MHAASGEAFEADCPELHYILTGFPHRAQYEFLLAGGGDPQHSGVERDTLVPIGGLRAYALNFLVSCGRDEGAGRPAGLVETHAPDRLVVATGEP